MRNGKVVGRDGEIRFYRDNRLNREDGPAVIFASGKQEWWLDGLRNREDGPAVIWPDGTQEWWRKSQKLTKKQWEKKQNAER